MGYQYKVVRAPERGARQRGLKTPGDRIAYAMQDAISEHATDGWEFVGTELVPCTEGGGWFSRAREVTRAVMVFRRDIREQAQRFQRRDGGTTMARAPYAEPEMRRMPAEAPAPAPAPAQMSAQQRSIFEGAGHLDTQRRTAIFEHPQPSSAGRSARAEAQPSASMQAHQMPPTEPTVPRMTPDRSPFETFGDAAPVGHPAQPAAPAPQHGAHHEPQHGAPGAYHEPEQEPLSLGSGIVTPDERVAIAAEIARRRAQPHAEPDDEQPWSMTEEHRIEPAAPQAAPAIPAAPAESVADSRRRDLSDIRNVLKKLDR